MHQIPVNQKSYYIILLRKFTTSGAGALVAAPD